MRKELGGLGSAEIVLDLHGKNRFQARVAVEAAVRPVVDPLLDRREPGRHQPRLFGTEALYGDTVGSPGIQNRHG